MTKRIEWKWEKIDDSTTRVKVMGGWLVVNVVVSGKGSTSCSSIFIADRDYEWMPVEPIVDPEVNKANLAKDYETPKV